MSKRRGIKKNMELKKLFIILVFSILSYNSHADIIKPENNYTPFEVVKIQLTALKNNKKEKGDLGIKQVWMFAHPKNKIATGPYERFKGLIEGEQYKILLNHVSHKINLIMNTKEKHIFKIEILAENKKLYFYEWHVEKGTEKNCNSCWFTSAVSIPVDQGNTI